MGVESGCRSGLQVVEERVGSASLQFGALLQLVLGGEERMWIRPVECVVGEVVSK